MRLIDVDELEKRIDKYCEDCCTSCDLCGVRFVIEDVIDRQPTAFDVDKVVSELERERDFHYKQMKAVDFENDIFAQHIFEEEHNRGIGLNKAIEIVKAGGRNE